MSVEAVLLLPDSALLGQAVLTNTRPTWFDLALWIDWSRQLVPDLNHVAVRIGAIYYLLFTVTVKVLVALLPQLSLAVTVTVVVPIGKKLPDAGLAVA